MIKHSELNPKLIKLIDSEDFVALKKIVANNIFNQTCANCEGKVKPNNFKAIGKKEYFISALCDECQVYFFEEAI